MDLGRVLGGLLGQTGQQTGRSDRSQGGLSGLLSGLGGSGGGAGLLGGSLGSILGGMRPPMGGGAGAAAAGGLLGSVLGGRGGGGLLRTGGMAVAGLMAYRAYEKWKAQQPGATGAPAVDAFAHPEAPGAAGEPFGLNLIRAMVAAAHADGAFDSTERERIFSEAERLELDADDKAEIFRILNTPADPAMIAGLAATEAQKAELYTVSAMIAGPATASERAYLSALAHALRLPEGLRARLDSEVQEGLAVGMGTGSTPA